MQNWCQQLLPEDEKSRMSDSMVAVEQYSRLYAPVAG